MFYYRLFFKKNSDGLVVGSEEIAARDDVEAVRIASAWAGEQLLELWHDKRKVKVFPPSEEGPQPFAYCGSG